MPLLGTGIYADQVEHPEIATEYSRTVFTGGTGGDTPTPEVWPGETVYSLNNETSIDPVSGGSFIPFATTSNVPTYDFSGMFNGSSNGSAPVSLLQRIVQWIRQTFS
jgi:hypothetical protein